jgi:hypothetical protein
MKDICEHARNIFLDKFFVDCIIEGMKNKVSFVRNAFIGFSHELIKKMHKVIGEKKEEIGDHIKNLIECYTELLGRVSLPQKEGRKELNRIV